MACRNHLDKDSALHSFKHPGDFLDCFSVELPHDIRPLTDLAQIVFIELPFWVHILLEIRDIAVSPAGLKTTKNLSKNLSFRDTLQVGEQINFLTILSLSEQEIILGEDDKHLDFRIAFRRDDTQSQRISLATLVRTHSWFGRTYLRSITPLHNRIVLSRLNALRGL